MSIKSILAAAAIALSITAPSFAAETMNDLEIAHTAYTAGQLDIRYAHLALAISENESVRAFAQTMIRDHTAVNDLALKLLEKLKVAPQDNFLSQDLTSQSHELINELSQLRGPAFDRRYAENELAYHRAVNKLVEGTFIPNLKNPEIKALFEKALSIFKAHELHAEKMVRALTDS